MRLTPQQREACRLIVTPPYKLLLPSANTQGKSMLFAVLASWFYDSFRPGVLLATAPRPATIKGAMFKELRRLRHFPHGFAPKDTFLGDAPDHFVFGTTTNNPDSFQGFHEEHVGILYDEGTGIDRAIFDRGDTMAPSAPGKFQACAYNPNDASSHPYALEASGDWHVLRLDALEHPNIVAGSRGEPAPYPSAVTYAEIDGLVRGMCDPYGRADPNSPDAFQWPLGSGDWWLPRDPRFNPRVRGRWPSGAFNNVWAPTLIDRCRRNAQPVRPDWPAQIGFDVAGFGDNDNVLCGRKGLAAMELAAVPAGRGPELARHAKEMCHRLDPVRPRSVPVLIDETGGWGSKVMDNAEGYNFIGVNSSRKSPTGRHPNMRSELWFHAAYAAEVGGSDLSRLPEAAYRRLHADLAAPRYAINSDNQKVVEGKRQTKARLGTSPDYGDAYNLAWWSLDV